MCIAVAYKKVKNRRGRLRELAFYQRFQLQGFDWDNLDCFGPFGSLFAYGRWSLTRCGRTFGFDCIKNGMKMT